MPLPAVFSRLKPDPYIAAIVGMVILATVLPAHGQGAAWVSGASRWAIALLFFLYGARLSRQSMVAGLTHWRLQLVILAATYVLFPLAGLLLGLIARPFLPADLTLGVVFLCMLPSTVQSSVAFTSIARGNVPAAVCGATLSNLLGVFLSPLLIGVFMHASGQGFSAQAVLDIVENLLLPFMVGQMLRPWIGAWIGRHRGMLGYVDRGSILLVVYAAFSEGMVHGLWSKVSLADIAILLLICSALLAAALLITARISRRYGFSHEDEIAIVFCGSKKSLASGVPMANILFAGSAVGMIVLPLMLFHQIQLMTCAVLAKRYAQRNVQGEK